MTLTEQYDAGTITPREYVERVWIDAEEERTKNLWSVFIRPAMFFKGPSLFNSGWHHKQDWAWQAAASFTHARMEEIADVKEEIENCTKILGYYAPTNDWIQRILVRERAHLDTLTRGLRPEAL